MSVSQPAQYGVRTFDLSVPRTLERVNIRADQFAILRADDSVEIRINAKDNAPIDAREVSSISIPPSGDRETGIERLYISNSAGTGKLKILTGFGGTTGDTDQPTGDEVDVTNRPAREIGKARVQDSAGVLVDPATESTLADVNANVQGADGSPLFAEGSTDATPVSLQIENRTTVDLYVDVSGSATLTVEARTDQSDWRTIEIINYSSNVEVVEQLSVAFGEVRATVDQALNQLEIHASGN